MIGSRSFSSRPSVAARMVRAQVCGYHRGGVATTVKHFPGHGSTTTDSHLHPARIRETRSQWRRTDLPPFARAVASRVDLVMLGHLAFPAMDPSGRPATISARLTVGCCGTGRVRGVWSPTRSTWADHVVRQHRLDRGRAIRAGVDAVAECRHSRRSAIALGRRRVHRGTISERGSTPPTRSWTQAAMPWVGLEPTLYGF